MFITVMTDASYCSRTRSAGYGFWIACERGKKQEVDFIRLMLLARVKQKCLLLQTPFITA